MPRDEQRGFVESAPPRRVSFQRTASARIAAGRFVMRRSYGAPRRL